jgi:dipeptidyl aminopeptidase/acylaminoacyl peptidase
MRKAVDGTGEPVVLVQSDYSASNADWSRDGRYVVFQGSSGGGTATDILYAELDASGGPYKPQAFLDTPAVERVPKLSADGRYVTYVSDESGRPEVYVRSFPDGAGRRQASSDGGTQPRWRDDGKELFYVESDQSLMAVPVSIAQELTLGRPQRLFDSQDLRFRDNPWPQYDISADGQSFLTATPADDAALPSIRIVENWYEEFRERQQ